MPSSGPNFPGTAANDSSFGSQAWSNTNNILANDTSFSTNNILTFSQYLKGTNFAFSIPTGATINGIQLEISRKANFSSSVIDGPRIVDSIVRLVKGGTISGDNKASTGTANRWPTTEAIKIYGDSTSLWGLTFTPADINVSDFGAVLCAVANEGAGSEIASVNFFRITIHYTESSGESNTAVSAWGIATGWINLQANP